MKQFQSDNWIFCKTPKFTIETDGESLPVNNGVIELPNGEKLPFNQSLTKQFSTKDVLTKPLISRIKDVL